MANILAIGTDTVTGQADKVSVNNSLTGPGTGTGSERFGSDSTAAGINAAAFGNTASATANGSTAVGAGAVVATGATADSIVVGRGASFTSAGGGINVGGGSTAFTNTVIVGVGSSVDNTFATVVGNNASGGANGAVVIGTNNNIGSGVTSGISIGTGTGLITGATPQSIIISGSTFIGGTGGGIVIGGGGSVTTTAVVDIGLGATTGGANTVVVGDSATIGAVSGAVAIGKSSSLPTGATTNSVVVGNGSAFTAAGGGVAIGTQTSPVAFTDTTAIGLGTTIGSQRSIVIGNTATTSPANQAGGGNIAIGVGASAFLGNGNVAIGDSSFSAGDPNGGIAIGLQAFNQFTSICMGYQTFTTGNGQFTAGRSSNPLTDVTFGSGVEAPRDEGNYSILGTGGLFAAEIADPTTAPTGTVTAGLTTTIAAGSNGADLATAGIIFVASTAGFPASGTIAVVTTNPAVQIVTYTSVTGGGTPSFNGVSAGAGLMATGDTVSNSLLIPDPSGYQIQYTYIASSIHNDFLGQTLPSPLSTPFVITTLGEKIILDAIPDPTTSFYGTLATGLRIYVETAPGSGVFRDSETNPSFDVPNDIIAPGAGDTPPITNTTGSDGHGHDITITGGRADTGVATAVAAGSEGVDLNGAAEIFVDSTNGFPVNGAVSASKTIAVLTDNGIQNVTYTSLNADGVRFMGPFVAAPGSIMHTGNSVTQLFLSSNYGGVLTLSGGTSVEGDGANVSIAASNGVTSIGADRDGGNLSLTAGAPTGAGTAGIITHTVNTVEKLRINEARVNVTNADLKVEGLPVPIVISLTTGIDLTAVAVTPLYTVPAGKTLTVLDALVKPTTATAVSTAAVAGIGIAAGEDDILIPQTFTGLTATNQRFKFLSGGTGRVGDPADVVSFGVDTGATATALVADVYLIGYLEG